MNTGVSVLVSAADSVSVPLLLTNEELIREILKNSYKLLYSIQYSSVQKFNILVIPTIVFFTQAGTPPALRFVL
jgi:hypothetical protein